MNISEGTLLGIKRKLVDLALSHQQKASETAQALMNEAQQMANDYGAPKDRYDAFRTKQMRQAEIYSNQFDVAQQNIRTLNKIELERVSRQVEFGSLVITDRQKMLVSVSLGKLELDRELYYAISVQVPLFKVMEGKKIGEEFTFNGLTQKITALI